MSTAVSVDLASEVVELRTQDGKKLEGYVVWRAGTRPRTGLLNMHPTAHVLQHYELEPMARAGFAAMRLKTRFAGDDTTVIMEEIVLDVAAGVKFLKEWGCEKVVFFGHSGAGQVSSLYQSQAENPTITATPAGDPPDLTKADLPPGDGLLIVNAHVGRNLNQTQALDPSVVDEHDPIAVDPALDMFDPRNYELVGPTLNEGGVRYSPEFLARYRQAQMDRSERITRWCRAKLAELERINHPVVRDIPFIFYRTKANPEYLDLSLNPAEKGVGTMWGEPYVINYDATKASQGRMSTLRSWLSHFSFSASQATTLEHIARCSVPTLVIQGTADALYPQAQQIFEASAAQDKSLVYIKGGTHYFPISEREPFDQAMNSIATWLQERGF
jgi:pimeloyl-ACP methyl ester carboxylesterase